MSDGSDRVAVVTGATSGIGQATATTLAQRGFQVVVVGRSRVKTDALVRTLQENGGEVSGLVADLCDLSQVHRLADTILDQHPQLHVLVNNAGALYTTRQETVDGFEQTLALNHLSYFALANALLPALRAGAPSRIVNVASRAHRDGTMRWDDLQYRSGYSLAGWPAYCQSKLANMMFTFELARRLEGTNITVNAVHPGFVRTGWVKNNGFVARLFMSLTAPFARTPEHGADTVIWAASSDEMDGVSGKYLMDRRIASSSTESLDQTSWERLWKISEEMVQQTISDPGAAGKEPNQQGVSQT